MSDETRSELEARHKREHYEKYQALAEELDLAAMAELIPATRARIQAALDAGDEHLNTIPLALWDSAVGYTARRVKKACACCGVTSLVEDTTRRDAPVWKLRNGRRLDVCYRLCVLKHVATHYTHLVRE